MSVGAVAVGYLAYYAYLIQFEIAEKERHIKTYESYMNGTCLYVIENHQDDTMVTKFSRARSMQEQYDDCVRLARYFGDESMRLKAKIAQNLAQKKPH